VGGMTVKLTFNKDLKWTKALKYMLTDLKLCLRWMIESQEAGELPT
jgi:beclin 1